MNMIEALSLYSNSDDAEADLCFSILTEIRSLARDKGVDLLADFLDITVSKSSDNNKVYVCVAIVVDDRTFYRDIFNMLQSKFSTAVKNGNIGVDIVVNTSRHKYGL